MKHTHSTEKNILIAFLLNLGFSIFEFIGGIVTNSVAIMSDSIHDMGDALSIGVSYFLERKSKKRHDNQFTYGYIRYSVLGSLITTVILLSGSIWVIYNSIVRIIHPQPINYSGMIIFAIFGVVVNFLAAYFTREGDSLNQKAVNLHMLEDVLGWVVVLLGAIIMNFTDIRIIDPIMSIVVAAFIFKESFINLTKIVNIFLIKTPENIDIDEITHHVLEIDGVQGVHHIHVWSIDGYINCATLHVVVEGYKPEIKYNVKEELHEHGIAHVTIEIEIVGEDCHEKECNINADAESHAHAHHHHHHHHH